MDKGTQRFALYCGLAFPFVFFAGMLVAGLLPLPHPQDSLEEVRSVWAEHPDAVRAGCFLMVASAALQAPLAGLIGVHMRKRVEQLVKSGCTRVEILQRLGISSGFYYRLLAEIRGR